MPDTNINLKAKDDTAAAFESASKRLNDLKAKIGELRGGDLSVLDVKNINTMTREIGGLERGLGNVKTQAGGMSGILGGIVPTVDVMDIANFAVDAGKAIVSLGQMGEESAQLDAKFTALAGGTANAANLFREMDAATGSWLTRDEKMEAGTRIMQLGLAGSAEEAGELAKTAILLGDATQTASQRIDSLTQMLATGQTRGLANFGVSIIAVRGRVDELKKANSEMTSEMATQQAILEATAGKVALLGDYMPVTATQEMANATADLKDSLGDIVAQPYIVSVKFLTEGLENIQSLLNRTSNDPAQQLQGIDKQIENAKESLEKMKNTSGTGILGGLFNQKYTDEQIAGQQKAIDDLIAKQQYLKGVTSEAGDAGVAGLDRQSNAAVLLKDNLQQVEDKYLELEGKKGEEAPTGAVDKASTRVDAAALVKNLQKGLFAPEVIGAIDVDKLATEPGMAGLARKSFEAFSIALQANKGKTNVADMLLNMEANEKGVTPADTAAAKAVNTLAAAIDVQVTGKDFVGKMIGYGETVWGYTEQGMINKAKSSTAFQAAIDAMVAAAIAGALQ